VVVDADASDTDSSDSTSPDRDWSDPPTESDPHEVQYAGRCGPRARAAKICNDGTTASRRPPPSSVVLLRDGASRSSSSSSSSCDRSHPAS